MKILIARAVFAISAVGVGALAAAGVFARTVPVARAQSYSTTSTETASSTTTAALIQISPNVLPDAVMGESYSQTLTALTTANGPFVWNLSAGTLPPGLALDVSATGTTTSITGTPVGMGTFTFTIDSTNGTIASTQTYIMNVDQRAALTASSTAATTTIATTIVATTTTTITTTPTPIPATTTVMSEQLEAELSTLMVQLQALEAEVIGGASFYRDLTIGDMGLDVQALQQFLNQAGFAVAPTGPGSAGDETQYFGLLTQAALASWQAANSISPAQGYFGPESRARISAGTVSAPFMPAASSSPSTTMPSTTAPSSSY